MPQIFFPLTLFLSAGLLFAIQPMVAKILLPVYGGTPAVWTVCMLFFQMLMLAAYGYAWGVSQYRHWRWIHLLICLLSLGFLPVAVSTTVSDGLPEFMLLENLLKLGLPLLVIGASAPLLQFAYSKTRSKKHTDPYFLYAASNAGSLLALLSYPWLIERFTNTSQQLSGWNFLYVSYLILLMGLLFVVRYQSLESVNENTINVSYKKIARWIAFSFLPCSLMLGVTFYITTDIAATPLFWVLPLALYLLSFVITFAAKPVISHQWVIRTAWLFLIFPLLGFMFGTYRIPLWLLVIAHLANFFMVALLCHGELARTRPNANRLTTFYFCLALGGVVAGLLNGIVASYLFTDAYEYPLVLVLVVLFYPGHHKKKKALMLCLVLSSLFIKYGWSGFSERETLSQQRNFYGIKKVFEIPGAHVLMSQSTMHGFQVMDGVKENIGARAYYGSVFPVVQRLQASNPALQVMVLGLGTGLMACQFREADSVKMVEIDEQVIDIAKNPNLFTYLRDCQSQMDLIKEDGRLAVGQIPDHSLDLLVMDAFNSDAIPVHLLTLQAFKLYQKKIKANGVILVNMTNRHLGVLPVITAVGRELDEIVLTKQQAGSAKLGQLATDWALLTTDERFASALLATEGWRFVAEEKSMLWTDEYSNLVPLLKW